MTAREYLEQGWKIEQRIRAAEERLKALRARAERIRSAAPRAAGGRGGRRGGWADAIGDICDAEADYAAQVAALYNVQRQVKAAIEGVEDVRLRTLLELRYLSFWTWPRIAEALGYDVRNVTRLHNAALRAVRVMDNRPNCP